MPIALLPHLTEVFNFHFLMNPQPSQNIFLYAELDFYSIFLLSFTLVISGILLYKYSLFSILNQQEENSVHYYTLDFLLIFFRALSRKRFYGLNLLTCVEAFTLLLQCSALYDIHSSYLENVLVMTKGYVYVYFDVPMIAHTLG